MIRRKVLSGYLSIESAKEFVRRSRIISEFRNGGARCPLCGNWGTRVYACVKITSSGKARRYFRCPDCGYKYAAE